MTLDELIARLRERVRIDGIPYPPATQEEIDEAEDLLDCKLPPVLRRLYTEVGNGGFGPGYGGVLGLDNGSFDDQNNTAVLYYDKWLYPEPFEDPLDNEHYRAWGPWQKHLLPICHWGCGIFSCVDCSNEDAPIIRFRADQYDPEGSFRDLFSQESPSIKEWLETWLARKERV